jgi:EmrB/QacA subfamily drug resistance transporter
MSVEAPAQVLSAQEHAAGFSGRRRTIALTVVALAFVMDLLDTTIVNIGIPSIQANLGASYSTIQWLVAGYSLAFALLLITGGRMGDVFGYKKLFMIGMIGFTLASLLSGLAWSPLALIGARLLQGSMAALMVPQVMSLMQIMYKPSERTSVSGLFGALGGLSASLGPIVGGILIKANLFGLDWRPIFLINVPVGIFGLWAAAKYLPEGKSPHPLKLDLVGTGIVIVALSLLIYPLIQGRELGWPAWTFAMIAASVPLLALFAWQQIRKMKKDGSPLVMPALFAKPSFSVGLLVNIIFEGAMLGFFLTFTLALQAGLGFDVLKAAVTGIPIAIGIGGTIAILGQNLVMKIGRYAMTIGTIIMSTGLLAMLFTLHHSGVNANGWHFAPALLLIGVGMGLIMAPLFSIVLNDVDANHAGAASGILNAVQQVGGAIGIALIGVIFFGQLSHNATNSFDDVAPQLRSELAAAQLPTAAQDRIITQVRTCFDDRAHQKDVGATPDSCKQDQTNSEASTPAEKAIGDAINSNAKTANAKNFENAFKAGVIYELGLLAAVFTLSFFLPRHIRPEAMQAGH